MTQMIDCYLEDNSKLARCLLRDDITRSEQWVMVLLLIIMGINIGFSIRNLAILFRTRTMVRAWGMIMLNAIILIFCLSNTEQKLLLNTFSYLLVRGAFYFDAILQLFDTGYPLYIYRAVEVLSIITFNHTYALGAYYWYRIFINTHAKVRLTGSKCF